MISKAEIESFFKSLQSKICSELETEDGLAHFSTEVWEHSEGGGGITRVIQDGAIFEKGGVNFSSVSGLLPASIAQRLNLKSVPFSATGISLVLHPNNPFIPTVHANFRYFETEGERWWFGGGMDLTPYYPFPDDILHFHSVIKTACDRHDPAFYPSYKKWCDEYFFIKHRNETRGVGGIFFDYLNSDRDKNFAFVKDAGSAFLDAYLPIVKKRKSLGFGEKEKQFQLFRRGRYVEFNLVYDKGTLFGLETGGRIESILMSLPPVVNWPYNFQVEPGSKEAELVDYLKPREWV